jgi:hypothetical protein
MRAEAFVEIKDLDWKKYFIHQVNPQELVRI